MPITVVKFEMEIRRLGLFSYEWRVFEDWCRQDCHGIFGGTAIFACIAALRARRLVRQRKDDINRTNEVRDLLRRSPYAL